MALGMLCVALLAPQFALAAAVAPESFVGGASPEATSFINVRPDGFDTIRLSWTPIYGTTGYNIYRALTPAGPFVRLGNEKLISGGASEYADTGLQGNTTYYYRVSSVSDGGESQASFPASATTEKAPLKIEVISAPISSATSTLISAGTATTTLVISPTTPTTTEIAAPAASLPAMTTPSGLIVSNDLAALLKQLTALQAELVALQTATKPTGISLGLLTQTMRRGAAGDEVKKLQTFLVSQGKEIYPEALVTGYFGPATERAVGRFQEAYAISAPKAEGYGMVGPKTKAKINELLAK